MPLGPTSDEFRYAMERLEARMDRGFASLNDRLDELNGRTHIGEVKDAEVRIRLDALEADQRQTQARHARDEETTGTRLTRRDKALYLLGAGVIGAFARVTWVVGEIAVTALKAAVKP